MSHHSPTCTALNWTSEPSAEFSQGITWHKSFCWPQVTTFFVRYKDFHGFCCFWCLFNYRSVLLFRYGLMPWRRFSSRTVWAWALWSLWGATTNSPTTCTSKELIFLVNSDNYGVIFILGRFLCRFQRCPNRLLCQFRNEYVCGIRHIFSGRFHGPRAAETRRRSGCVW